MEHSLTKQMSLLFIGRALAIAFSFTIPLVLVRVFSQEDFGLYKQLFLIQGTLLVFLSLGLPPSLYYFLPRNRDTQSKYVFHTLVLLIGMGALGFLGLLQVKGSLAGWFNNSKLEPLIPYMGIVIAFLLISRILEIVMVARRQAGIASVACFLSESVKAILLIGAAVATRDMFAIVMALVAYGLFRVCILVLYLRRESLLAVHAIQRRCVYDQLGYSLPLSVAVILCMLAGTLPQYFIASSYDPAIFAIFAVGCIMIPYVALLFDSVVDVAQVKMAELVNDGEIGQVPHVISDSIRKLSLIYFPLFLFLLIMAREFIVGLYTYKFEASVPIFMMLSFMIPLTAVSLDYVPRAFGNTSFLVKIHGVRLLFTTIMLFILIDILCLLGAAISIVIGMAIANVYALIRVKRLARATLLEIIPLRIIGKIMGYSMVPAVIVLVMHGFFELTPLLVLFISLIVFTTVYLTLIWNSELITPDEKKALVFLGNHTKAIAVALLGRERRVAS